MCVEFLFFLPASFKAGNNRMFSGYFLACQKRKKKRNELAQIFLPSFVGPRVLSYKKDSDWEWRVVRRILSLEAFLCELLVLHYLLPFKACPLMVFFSLIWTLGKTQAFSSSASSRGPQRYWRSCRFWLPASHPHICRISPLLSKLPYPQHFLIGQFPC